MASFQWGRPQATYSFRNSSTPSRRPRFSCRGIRPTALPQLDNHADTIRNAAVHHPRHCNIPRPVGYVASSSRPPPARGVLLSRASILSSDKSISSNPTFDLACNVPDDIREIYVSPSVIITDDHFPFDMSFVFLFKRSSLRNFLPLTSLSSDQTENTPITSSFFNNTLFPICRYNVHLQTPPGRLSRNR